MIDNTRESEIAVIGSILIDSAAFEAASRVLTVDDFCGRYTAAAFEAACELRDSGGVIDPLTIAAGMESRLRENCFEWLKMAMDITPTAANVGEYCKLMQEDANRRRVAKIAESATRRIAEGVSWQDAADKIGAELAELQREACELIKPGSLERAWREYIARVRVNPDHAYCKTGFPALDRRLGGGMFRQGLYVIGARPGMGKTTFALNIAENMARENRPVLFVSLEMSETQIMTKRLALELGAGYTLLMSGTASDELAAAAVNVSRQMEGRPFYSVCRRVTTADIERIARSVEDLEAVFIDYLGLISPREEMRERSRYEQASEISAELKSMAKRLNLPVVVLAQLNREGAKEKRPQLHQLRDSGSIEQDADAVMLLYRESYFSDEDSDDAPEIMEFIVAKNRHGGTGAVKLLWNGVTGQIHRGAVATVES